MTKFLFGSVWACLATATAAVIILPLPFEELAVLTLGVIHGWLLKRHF